MTIKPHTSAHQRSAAIVIIRVDPDDPRWDLGIQCSHDYVKKGCQVQVFLHGMAVVPELADPPQPLVALSQSPDTEVVICQAAWQRLGLSEPPPLAAGSLVGLWSQLIHAEHVSVWGQGEWPAGHDDWPRPRGASPTPAPAWGVLVAHAPDVNERQSLLEFVLAGAVLELDAALGFGPKALAELSGDSARTWSQLTDHHLATVITGASEDAGYHRRQWLVL